MAISIQNHSALIASKVVGKFQEDIPVRAGFSGFFPSETTPMLHVDVEVERDNDLIAVDVMRFTEGNKNKFTRATEHKYVPPFYREDYDFARDEVYMTTAALGATNVSGANQAIAQNALKNVRKNRKKIERAIRKQQSEVLQTGIVLLKNGDSIDYRRKAASIVDLGAGNYWNQANGTPAIDFGKAMRFLRDVGNSTGQTINAVMRTAAMDALLQNDSFEVILDSRRMERARIDMPQFNEASGLAFHGQVAGGDFVINLWTYNEKYTDENGATKYYMEEENVVVLPSDFMGKTVFGGLPYMQNLSINGVTEKVPQVKEAQFF